jgi:hypothetical protein
MEHGVAVELVILLAAPLPPEEFNRPLEDPGPAVYVHYLHGFPLRLLVYFILAIMSSGNVRLAAPQAALEMAKPEGAGANRPGPLVFSGGLSL